MTEHSVSILTNDSIRISQGDSPIRKMFALAQEMRAAGKKPIDLSLGNPSQGPGRCYQDAIEAIAKIDRGLREQGQTNPYGYPPNAGLPETRKRVASDLSEKFGIKFSVDNVFITAGAANAIDVLLRTLIEPILVMDDKGSFLRKSARASVVELDKRQCIFPDEVIVTAPYFVEYGNYCRNNQAVLRAVKARPNFHLDVDAIVSKINKRTRVVFVNSPNNPTGAVYTAQEYWGLSNALREKSAEFGTRIVVIEDVPYNPIVFGTKFETMLNYYTDTILVDSFSKTWGIPGERLGYAVVSPHLLSDTERTVFNAALTANLRNRVVNAPLLQQKVLTELGCVVGCDVAAYGRNVRKLEETLLRCGFKLVSPQGTFYLFPEIPERFQTMDDFQKAAWSGEDPLLYVPGTAFAPGMPGYVDRNIRLGACVSTETIERACDKLERVCKAA